ncbi:MAG TPA: hypothetical protein VMU87_09710 [Stellaceae bacterium]|nr:hypothetical protein [Stellaceae bacterium]
MTATATTPRSGTEDAWREGADNLLLNCAALKPGQTVLVINEPAVWAERPAIEFIEARARVLGGKVQSVWTGRPSGPDAIPAELSAAIAAADITIFNHMMGAMLRFRPLAGNGVRILNYATTGALLESDFCRVPYGVWTRASALIAKEMNAARRWRVTCPLGSDIEGTVPESERVPAAGTNADGFALRTFPIGTHPPKSSLAASGRIAVRWLVSSSLFDIGSQGMRLDDVIHLEIERGRIRRIDGAARTVAQAKDFLEAIGRKRGKEGLIVNSWHIGVNPQAFSPWRDTDDLEAWMNLAHNNPRMLHFHAVGDAIPGDISLPLIDPTVEIDGRAFWDKGRSTLLDEAPFRALAAEGRDGARAFALNAAIGV